MRNYVMTGLRAGRVLLGIGALSWAPSATAQTAECIPAIEQSDPDGDGIFFEHITSAGLRDVRVSSTNLGTLQGVSATGVVRAFGLAAGIWSEQGGGRPMRYRGETTLTDIPVWLDDCEAGGSIDSIVVVDPGSDPEDRTDTAKIGMRCIDMFTPTVGLGWAFKLTIYAKDRDGNFNPWVNGANTLSTGQKDLVGTLVHELGHAYNLTHHSDVDNGDPEVQFSVMGRGDTSTRRRDLYWRDIQCITGLSRSSSMYRRPVDTGAVGAESLFDQGFLDRGWGKVSAGVRFSSTGGVLDWSHAAEASGCTRWAQGVPFTGARCLPSSNDFHVFTEAVWRDRTPANSRVLWSDPSEYIGTTLSNGSRDAVHRVRGRRSSDGFVSGTTAFLDQCSTMSGDMTCTNTAPVVSSFSLATAWHDTLSRTVTAWAHQDRGNNTNSHAVRIAVGSVGETTLPVHDTLTDAGAPVQTNVAPGLVCKNNQANGFDCMVAVVPQSDSLGVIRVYRFSVAKSGNRYVITMDPTSTLLSGERTGNRIAAWHHENRFWIAFRSLNGSQPLQIRSSADTLTWSGSGPGGNIDAGPSAVSYSTTNNQLMYVR